MDEILTQKIRDDFDRIALYDREVWNHNNRYHKFLLKQLPLHCERVLDIGCGTGAFSRLLAERCHQVVAIDLSPQVNYPPLMAKSNLAGACKELNAN
ncbi:methyltransferase domain-containing protein [Pleurocapsales cyanobacterium LEGE 06147]|nr:methyltransferase domain-containing protein [Pleurocapsales cyanobacterium LEGE 06147]